MLGTTASSITSRAGIPGRIEAVKSGAVSFFRSSSTITSLAICRRLAARSSSRSSRHVCDAPLQSGGQGFIKEGGPNDGAEDFMQVGEPLDGIGEGLLVDLGIFCADSVADGPVVDSRKLEIHE